MSVPQPQFSRDQLAVVAVLTLWGEHDIDDILALHGHGLTKKRINNALTVLNKDGIVHYRLHEAKTRGLVLSRDITWYMADQSEIAAALEARHHAAMTEFDHRYPTKTDW